MVTGTEPSSAFSMATIPRGASPVWTARKTSVMDGYGKGCSSPGMLASSASSVNVPSGSEEGDLVAGPWPRPVSSWSTVELLPDRLSDHAVPLLQRVRTGDGG